MRRAVIDDIVFQAAPLGERAAAWPPLLSVHLSAGTHHKGFTQPLPLFARRAPMPPGDANWAAYCGLLKDLGIPLQTTAASLESLSVANVPVRFARRGCDEGFDALELETAEAIEISCGRRLPSATIAQFPLEISAWHELKLLIDTLRELSSSGTSIGLGLVAGDVGADIANALAARADFVILEMPSASIHTEPSAAELDVLVWSAVAARAACIHANAPGFPIYVDAALTRADDLIKLLALGASAVSIDALAHACLPPTTAPAASYPKGMLSGIGGLPKPAAANVSPLENRLTGLIAALKSRLQQQQLGNVHDLGLNQLRALSEGAARLAAIQLLGH